ncbi:MAG TPA: hypothetical protein DEF48_26840 [Nostoc sp. UBA8866]|nr:hypothetical protein [Nostoc sp. UBA8866]
MYVILFSCCISLLLILIHKNFNSEKDIFWKLLGLTSFISGVLGFLIDILLYFNSQNKLKRKVKLVRTKQEKTISEHQIIWNSKGGNIEQNIARDFIGRDAVTNNNKKITIKNREVEVNPNNIIQTFDDFRDILAQSIIQSSDALEAIREFAQELTEQLRNQPEVKSSFGVDKNISINGLLKEVFIELLTKNYNQINEKDENGLIVHSNKIEGMNISKTSNFIEYFKYWGHNNYDIIYKTYTIQLFQEEGKLWHYRIKRSDSSFLEKTNGKPRLRSSDIYTAIGKAIREIEREITKTWKNNSEPI